MSALWLDFVPGVNDFGFGVLVCLAPVTNLATGSDFDLAIKNSFVMVFCFVPW